MNQAIITTKNRNDLIKLISFVKDLKYVTAIEPVTIKNTKHLTDEDWIRPGRPATDEEFEQMISKAEKSPLMTVEEAKAHTYKLIDKWNKKRK